MQAKREGMLHRKTAMGRFARFHDNFLYHFSHSADTSTAGPRRRDGAAIEPTKDLQEN